MTKVPTSKIEMVRTVQSIDLERIKNNLEESNVTKARTDLTLIYKRKSERGHIHSEKYFRRPRKARGRENGERTTFWRSLKAIGFRRECEGGTF